METILTTIQIVVAILLSLAVLTQNNGSGFSSAIGGTANTFTPSKRGAEKVLFNATIVLAMIFIANSIAFIFI